MAKNFFSKLFGGRKHEADTPSPPSTDPSGELATNATPTTEPPAEFPGANEPGQTNDDASASPVAYVVGIDRSAPDEDSAENRPTHDAPPPAGSISDAPPAPQPEPANIPLAGAVPPAAEAITPHKDDVAPGPAEGAARQPGWLSRLRDGLSRTSSRLSDGVASIFTKRRLDDEAIEALEDLLIAADLGVSVAAKVTTELARDRFDKEVSDGEVRAALARIVADTLRPSQAPLTIDASRKPFVIVMVGVNGAGKTTTIGKLAARLGREGKSVMIAAGDTFRAAAIEQLQVWGERANARVIAREVGADAAGLAFDALKAARETGADVLLIDTAGRLQNRRELMDELAKIVRVLKKLDETAPHATLLTLDATVGQNALSQAQAFGEIAAVTGLVMTKLDGTARGGVLVALAERHRLPIHYVGVGEGIDDLQPFDSDAFARALTGVV